MPILSKVVNAHPAQWGRLGFAPRRDTAAFSSRPAEELGQPQDGARFDDASASAAGIGSREPEDARLTGGTRSLMRRVLGLNVTRPALKPVRSAAALGITGLPTVSAA